MTRPIVGIAASAMLLVVAAPAAHAQRAASWPSAGTHLVRVEDASSTPAVVPASGNPAAVLKPEPCAARLRDPETGREYLLRHSSREENFAQRKAGATTTTTTRLLRAVGDYARIELKGDTLSTRVIAVDCLTTRVRPPQRVR
jgi:hypothetical protein